MRIDPEAVTQIQCFSPLHGFDTFWALCWRLGLTVGHENHAILPIEILDAHALELTLVSHSRIAHQDDDVTQKLKGSTSPGVGLTSFEQLLFCFIVQPKMPPMLLHHFDFWSVADHLPLLRFVENSSPCLQSAIRVRGRARKFQLLGTIASDLVHSAFPQRLSPLTAPSHGAPTKFGRLYFSTLPNIGEIRTLANEAWSVSHGFQVKLEKRFSGNWSMLNSYTWQHSVGQTDENEYLEPQDTYNLSAERGNNAPDYRHQLSSAWSYLLPIGPKLKLWSSEAPFTG